MWKRTNITYLRKQFCLIMISHGEVSSSNLHWLLSVEHLAMICPTQHPVRAPGVTGTNTKAKVLRHDPEVEKTVTHSCGWCKIIQGSAVFQEVFPRASALAWRPREMAEITVGTGTCPLMTSKSTGLQVHFRKGDSTDVKSDMWKLQSSSWRGLCRGCLIFQVKGGMRLSTHLEGGYPQSQMTVTASGPYALSTFQIFSL